MPDVRESSDNDDFVATATEEDRYAELLLAGFQACAKEALRFLMEEEGLSPDDPLPTGLNEHLVRQQCHLANSIHNDSGVDLEESFLITALDGDTSNSKDNLSSTPIGGDTKNKKRKRDDSLDGSSAVNLNRNKSSDDSDYFESSFTSETTSFCLNEVVNKRVKIVHRTEGSESNND